MQARFELCRDLLSLSFTKRWVISPMAMEQSVADHTFRVMALVRGLLSHPAVIINDTQMSLLWDLAMRHDLEECWTGDIPGTHKDTTKPWPHPSTLMQCEIIIKVADSMETYTWAMMNYRDMGQKVKWDSSTHGRDFRKIRHYTQDWPELMDAALAIFREVFNFTPQQLEEVEHDTTPHDH